MTNYNASLNTAVNAPRSAKDIAAYYYEVKKRELR